MTIQEHKLAYARAQAAFTAAAAEVERTKRLARVARGYLTASDRAAAVAARRTYIAAVQTLNAARNDFAAALATPRADRAA